MEHSRPLSASCPVLHISISDGNTQARMRVNIPLSLSLSQSLSFSLILILAPFIQNEKYTFIDVTLEIMQLQEIT